MREKTPRLQEQVSDGKRLPHECSETVAKANAMDLVYIFDLTAGVYVNFDNIYRLYGFPQATWESYLTHCHGRPMGDAWANAETMCDLNSTHRRSMADRCAIYG